MNIDNIFKEKRSITSAFVFDQAVVDVFDDMIIRSVPGYQMVIDIFAQLIERYAVPNTVIYDLGCSKGHLCRLLASKTNDDSMRVIGIDNSAPMIQNAQELTQDTECSRVQFILADFMEPNIIKNAGAVILCLSLQFLRPLERPVLLKRIYENLAEGGIVLLYEKTIDKDPEINSLQIELYYDFKRENGYSEMEISQKRTALENVLIPFTSEENASMLKNAGFKRVVRVFQWMNFVAYLAIK